jgi:hypothetical protein
MPAWTLTRRGSLRTVFRGGRLSALRGFATRHRRADRSYTVAAALADVPLEESIGCGSAVPGTRVAQRLVVCDPFAVHSRVYSRAGLYDMALLAGYTR